MDPGNPFDEIWESQKNKLKAKRVKLRWKRAVQKVKPIIPKRLNGIKEIWKYYLNNCSFHGLRYWLDERMRPFERVIWVVAFFIGFGWATKIILHIYSDFQLRKSNIIIDEINTDIDRVPFPSVTICPATRVDWIKALAAADRLIPKGNNEARQHFLELLGKYSDFSIPRLREMVIPTNDSILKILTGINMSELMLDVLPECESFIFNCSWFFNNQSCCDIFELQVSSFGYCYSFNSLTSEKVEDKNPRNAHTFGIRSGLRFSAVLTDQSHLPPSLRTLNYRHTMPIIISDGHVIPMRGRYFAFGHRYYVSLKFTCGYASDEILALESKPEPPCRYLHGYYKYENCLLNCWQTLIKNRCKCDASSFFYPFYVNVHYRPCDVSDLRCISVLTHENHNYTKAGIDQLRKQLHKNQDSLIRKVCKCPNECEYISYDDFTVAIPAQHEDTILIDIHFEGPTGVCYKREIVVTSLNMLVQFGGIFGLFVGGSVISCAELFYSILLTIVYAVCCKFSYFKKKEKIQPVIEVNSCDNTALAVSRKNNNHNFRNNYLR